MMTDRNRIIYLLEKYAVKETTESEENELFEIVMQVEHDSDLQHEVTMIFEETEPAYLTADIRERILKNVLTPALSIPIVIGRKGEGQTQVRRIFSWQRVTAAAAIILMIGTGTYFLFFKTSKNEIAKTGNPNPIQNDVVPGGNKAILTLADNTQIILDSAANGTLTQQGNTKILKHDGQLAYNALTDPSTSLRITEVLYNIITTPRGGQYQLTLSDGTKVWLNAASSLRFPAAFAGKERKVELTGEGYFEVAKNASMPFKVDVAGKGEVEVLGTYFNINSYTDEPTINTTLLEGKVKLTPVQNSELRTQNSELLSPGQQAQLNNSGQINFNENVNMDEVVAWKNGKFVFENADIRSIMRQLERWYDVEVSFNSSITTEEFVGITSRNVNVSQILKMLEKTGAVKFEIEGKRIIVK